jgi:hypothetical protein
MGRHARRRRKSQEKAKLDLSEFGLFPPDQALLTAQQACAVLKISRRTLLNWSSGRRPRLASVKFGYARRWVVADVLKMIESFKIAANPTEERRDFEPAFE